MNIEFKKNLSSKARETQNMLNIINNKPATQKELVNRDRNFDIAPAPPICNMRRRRNGTIYGAPAHHW